MGKLIQLSDYRKNATCPDLSEAMLLHYIDALIEREINSTATEGESLLLDSLFDCMASDDV